MIKKMIGALALSCLLSVNVHADRYPYESVPGDPMQARIYTMKNGLKVFLSVNKAEPRIQTYIAVRTGSHNDPAETTGLAHYLEHLMFKGTTNFGTSDLAKEQPLLDEIERRYEQYRKLTDEVQRKAAYRAIDSVSQIAAQYNIPNEYDKMMAAIGSKGSNAYTSNDVTCYVENIPSNEVENWAKVQADRFQNMVIRGFHTELESVYEEYNIGLANDGNKLYDAMTALLFPKHPYGTQTTIGTQQHLKNPSITNIKQYFKRYYAPNNIAICLSGDMEPDAIMDVLEKYFGDWKPNNALSEPQFPPLKPISAPRDTTVYGLEAQDVALAWRFDRGNSLQQDTLFLINELLYNGKAGLLDTHLNQPMKVQNAGAYSQKLNDYSMFCIFVQPKEGQSMTEARSLALDEIRKLREGQFDEKLLGAILNNYKRYYYEKLDQNVFRADAFVQSYINREDWKQTVGKLSRLEKLTKKDIVAFAQAHLTDNSVVTVYKEQGNDTTIHKIDKPAITPIPTNNDKHSAFLDEVVQSHTKEIQPQFVDFKRDLQESKIESGKSTLLYKKNVENDLFELRMIYPVGTEDCKELGQAQLIQYAGLKGMDVAAVQKKFYEWACDFDVNVSDDETVYVLRGLNKNFAPALHLFYELLQRGAVSKEDYSSYVDAILKARKDAKASQNECFNALTEYAKFGKYNSVRNVMTESELKQAEPGKLLRLLGNLRHLYPATILYYGPSEVLELEKTLHKQAPIKKGVSGIKLSTAKYQYETTPENEVYIAPYDAKNIYMMQYHNEDKAWSLENKALNTLFNYYFSNGMSGIVFQELREARGLAYSAGARYVEPDKKGDSEMFYTFIITQNDKMNDCVTEFRNLIDSMPEREAAFDMAKKSLMKQTAARRVLKFDVLQYYYAARKLGLSEDPRKLLYEQVPTLTLADLVRFAQERIAHKPYRYIILGNEKELDMNAIQSYGKVKRLTLEDIFGY